MTARDLAEHWRAPISLIRHWCRRELLPATKTAGVWTIEPHVGRPPYRTGAMVPRLFELRKEHWNRASV